MKRKVLATLVLLMLLKGTKAVCSDSDDCRNDAVCNKNVHECFCPVGWMGTICEIPDPSSWSSNTAEFASYNLENGGIIACVVGSPCAFPVYTTGFTSGQSAPFTVGPIAGDLSVDVGIPREDQHHGTVTTLILRSHTQGNKKICLKNRLNATVCYKVNVEVKNNYHPSLQILSPSYPKGSSLPCSKDMCRMFMYTRKLPNKDCSFNQVIPMGTAVSFTAKLDTQPETCATEFAIRPTSTSLTITYMTGNPLELVNYKIEPRLHKKDPCASEACSGHGSCLNVGQASECVCEDMYEGAKCEKAMMDLLSPDPKKPRIIGPTAANSTVLKCLGVCHMEVVVDPGSAEAKDITVRGDVGIALMESTHVNNKGQVVAKMMFTPPTQTDTYRTVCLTAESKTAKSYSWCLILLLKQTTTTPPNNGDIISASLPTQTMLTCIEGSTCSVSLDTKPGTQFTLLKATIPASLIHDASAPSVYNLRVRPSVGSVGYHRICLESYVA